MINLLLIDDDVELANMLSEYLQGEGFSVTTVHDGESGIKETRSGNYDLAVIDVMMPGISGIDVLGQIRRESRLPILMLTARGDDVDRIVGLEMGADDYVPKPSTPRELVARIRAILRRVQVIEPVDGNVIVGSLVMRPQQRTAELNDKPLQLTSAEFNLLEVLANNAGRVVSKQILSEQGMGRPLKRYDRSIDVHVSSLRHKLGERADGMQWIETVRSKGYQLIPGEC